MKGADHIFILLEIDTCLAADTAVYLGQERCRKLDKINAAQIGCGRISGHVTGNASAKGNNIVLSVKLFNN